ncbi:uncharacterized protein LOC8271762 isoform X1 [Ricinus communis]|uniref:uncharacterized protein LOC8271762 isoform X1 n=1 Tax=Ricinus communis TaxID=3988 RepID=UPI00201AC085|nr:uncharacterized protein LOC8271762 isoform X1 [Ricinus communis]XP_048233668.1 uncharacterized protein LOC8271762 isoform X1 [Ricinus communis]
MGRHLERQDSDIVFQRHLPGCMWSMLHILDYHHWHSVKKMSPRRRYRRGKHTICCGYPKTISFAQHTDELQNYLDADAVPLLDEQQTIEAAPSEKIPGKAQIKASVAKEMSARSQLQRAISINRLGHSDNLGGTNTDWPNPIIILERSADTAASRMQVPILPKGSEAFSSEVGHHQLVSKSLNHYISDDKQLSRETSHRQFMECVDVQEIFNINKKLFMEILRDPDVQAAKDFHIQLTSERKLKKSGSFPLAVSPHKLMGPVTLEQKWNETWSFRQEQRFPTGVEKRDVVAAKSDKSTGAKADDSVVTAVTQGSELSSSPLSQGSHKHGWHQSFMRHLKDVMKKIRHTHKESKKTNNHTLINALLLGVPSSSSDEKETPERIKEDTIHQDSCHEANSSGNGLSKDRISHIRRVSSLNESMDRYARLFEHSSTKEPKWHKYQSKSLRLTNEDKYPPTGSSFKSFRRRLSLPDLDSFCPLPNETSHDALPSGRPIKTNIYYDANAKDATYNDLNSVRTEQLDVVEETDLPGNIIEEGNSCENNEYPGDLVAMSNEEEVLEDIVEVEDQGHCPHQDQEIGSTVNSSTEHENESPVSVLETHSRLDITSQTEFQFSKDSDLHSRSICVDEQDCPVDLQHRFNRNSLTFADHENAKNAQTKIDNNLLHFELNRLEDADFSYVRDVLELSGCTEQGYLGAWHSLDQPLSPTLFKELEAYIHQESECSSEDVGCNCDHQLLFDLINEVLPQIYGSSLAYFPRPFSFTQRIRPLPKGNHIPEEVCKRISSYRSSGLKVDQSLNDIVAGDLAKDDSWLNLQLDVEDIALDLEDLIFDELLDEVMCS